LIYDFSLHRRNYLNKNTLFPEDDPGTRKRQDDEYTHLFRVEVPVGGGFTVGADYQGTNQRSNLAPYTYTRSIYTLSVSYAYRAAAESQSLRRARPRKVAGPS